MVEIRLSMRDWYFIATLTESFVDKNMLVIWIEKNLILINAKITMFSLK